MHFHSPKEIYQINVKICFLEGRKGVGLTEFEALHKPSCSFVADSQ
jgi:hypothetical protein